MRPFRGSMWACALIVLAVEALPARAAWCNVFQVCWHRKPKATAAYYYAPPAVVANSSPCCNPCPPPCTTSYVQRCYYQPVTSYQTKTYYEPVTTYRTSYYYEPVTTYRYSCYYDPCSCSYQQVATPCTSYSLKSKTDACQSWVQRCTQEPVTTYQQSFYWEPVTSCCGQSPAPQLPVSPVPNLPPAGVAEPRPSGGAAVSEYPNSRGTSGQPRFDRYPPYESTPPALNGTQQMQWAPSGINTQRPVTAPANPPVRLRMDRVTSASGTDVRGQVLKGDASPWAGARVIFVNVEKKDARQSASTNLDGMFSLQLEKGDWLVYVQGTDGRPIYQKTLDVQENEPKIVTLVSR